MCWSIRRRAPGEEMIPCEEMLRVEEELSVRRCSQ
jgi:hypothetical protein